MDIKDNPETYLFRMWKVEGKSLSKGRDVIKPLREWLEETFPDDVYELSFLQPVMFTTFEDVTAASIWIFGHTNAMLFKMRWHDDISFHVFGKELKLYK